MLRKRPFDQSGVSEVLGTILVLLITVIIFSSIILWVYTIPTPTARGRVSFEGSLTGLFDAGAWNGAYINLTHLGGDDLPASSTRIYLTIGNRTEVLQTKGTIFDGVSLKNYGVKGPDAHWNIGEDWIYLNESIPQDALVSVIVVDLDRGVVLWDEALLGAPGSQAPIFLDKWVDSDPSTATRDTVKVDDKFTLYAKIIDPDADLNSESVWAYLTFGLYGTPLGYVKMVDNGDSLAGDKTAGDGVFSRSLTYAALKRWDGGIIILNATDLGGHETKTRLILKVTDFGSIVIPEGPEGLTFHSNLQRFDIYNETAWDDAKYNAESTRTFKKGETVVVVVASKYLPNLDLSNALRLYDVATTPVQAIVYSNPPYTQGPSSMSVPSSTSAFTFLEYVDGFYIYTHKFSTNSSAHGYDGVQLAYGTYPVEIDLKASIVEPPKNRLFATDSILVTDQDGNAPAYPRILFYKDALHTQPATSFQFTEKVYVVLEVKSTDGTFQIGDVILQDFLGGIQVWAEPGNSPVSAAAINNSGLDAKRYAFSIDLTSPNFDAWLYGNNSYNFRIRTFSDLDENYGYLTRQVDVIGPLWLLDIMNSVEEFKNPMGQKFYGYFYRNDRSWQKTAYEVFDSTPQEQDPKWGKGPFYSIALGEFDGDGDLDAVVGIKSGGVLVYRNVFGDGSMWQRIILDVNAGSEVRSVAAGDVDQDGDDDVVAGTQNGQLWLYENDGYWSSSLIDSANWFTSLKFADVDGDGDLDLVAGNKDKKVHVYFNDGNGIFGTTLVASYYAGQETTALGTRAGGLGDLQTSDDIYESITEALTNGTSFTERIQDTPFLSDLSAWPVQVLTQTQGQTVWDSESATTDGSGSFRAENTLGQDSKFAGYREQVLSQPINASTGYTLTLSFRKSWVSSPPDTQQQGLVLRYEDGTLETVWEDDRVQSSGTWYELRVDGASQSGHGDVVAVRLTFDLNGPNGVSAQARVWFDDVSIQTWEEDGQTSRLEHTWVLNNVGSGGTTYRLKMQAYHTPNLEDDDIEVYYSLDDKAYIRMFTVTKTQDDDAYQAFVLPTWVGGQNVYIKAIDLSWENGSTGQDTLYIDHLVVERITVVTPNSITVDMGSEVNTVAVGRIDLDSDEDIAAGLQSGYVAVLLNGGTGTSWSRVDIPSSNPVLSVGVGDFDNDGDGDVAAGTDNKRVYVHLNTNGAGTSWSSTTLEEDVDKVFSLATGDVNGDGWSDIVIGTNQGNVYYYQNQGAQGWTRYQIDFVKKEVWGVALGDVDLGVLP